MALDPKQDMTRQTDIERLNHVLYDEICRIKDIVVQTRLMLAVMDALDELENAMHRD